MNKNELDNLLKRIPPLKAVVALAVIYSVTAIVTYFFSRGDWTAVQTVSTVLTGLVLFWYTWETQLLRQEAQRQTELQLRPCVIAEYRPGMGVIVTNIGSAPALNVQVEDILADAAKNRVIKMDGTFHILKPAESASVENIVLLENNHEAYSYLVDEYLEPARARRTVDIKVSYTNIDMKNYSTVTRVSRGKTEILKE